MNGKIFHLVCICIFLLSEHACAAHVLGTEPRSAKFDFEEKVLEKLVNLEHKTGLTIKSLEETNVQLQEELDAIKRELDLRATWSIYTQWGRTECSRNQTKKLYKGYIAGGHHNKGSGANLLCLPEKPAWEHYDDSTNSHRAYIFGTEIDIRPQADSENIFGYEMNEHDLPCAVCETQFSVTHMFPGQTTCFPGWFLQYKGYLVSSRHNHDNMNYECLDGTPEKTPKGSSNDDQCIVYLVEAKCGSLPCPRMLKAARFLVLCAHGNCLLCGL